ncbi:uncharacterized protein LOC131224658 isoform X2 [Magnolia sinica]|uniref:uncharacterized protein LOC131224658 isoform X2 n=1 Tax=Magnolia sinica TaxID=86752 RepID=UPI002659F906|nr:uncharacterized protein LOC131224658 isoform X2 [Magnolia sinica]
MFKAARWRSEKNKIKVVFKLQFQATQVPQIGWDALMVSLVPVEVGKPTVKSEKAVTRDGTCRWENPIYETVRFSREPKTGKINEKIYQFLISTGQSKSGLLGEVTIDFADYAEATKPSSVSLPLKTSKSGTVLHVTIHRIQAAVDGREAEENGDVVVRSNGRTLKSQFSNSDTDGSFKSSNDISNSIATEDGLSISREVHLGLSQNKTTSHHAESNGVLRASIGNDAVSASSLDSSSGQDTSQEFGLKNNGIQQDVVSFVSSLSNNGTMPQKPTANPVRSALDTQEHRRSNTDWSVSSAPDGSTDESTNSSEDAILKDGLQGSDVSSEKLKNEIGVLARQAEVSELELQTLRKQIMKESRRGADLSKEVCNLKEERDAAKRECERLKAVQREIDFGKVSNKSQFDSQDHKHLLEEIKQELNYEKDLNANLRLQLQKTQESNSELILAVQDMEELLERKNKETPCVSSSEAAVRAAAHENGGPFLHRSEINREGWGMGSKHESEDEEQHALEELIRERIDADVAYSLEQKIIDLSCEIEMYKKEREELEMQMEQLALEYEILKQENHDMSSKLEQNRLQEQLKMQYECSASLAVLNDLEIHVESLEKELEKQAEAFEADLAAMTRARVEQEQRAIQAEEALRKTRWNNANTAERLQEEFQRLSMQMASTFDANEKLAMQALTEASELRLEKCHLEDLLAKANEELRLMNDQYKVKMEELSKETDLRAKQIDQLILELAEKSKEIENQKQYGEESEKAFSEETLMLRTEIEKLKGEKNDLSEQVELNGKLRAEIEQMKTSIDEMEMLLERGNEEREILERKVKEAEKSLKELNDVRHLKDEKEMVVESLQSEVETLRAQYNDLKHTLFEDEFEKENLRKQVFHLRGDLRKKEDAITVIEKKLKDSSARVPVSDGATKPASRNNKTSRAPPATKEVSNLREKIKLLEGEIKQKEAAFENSTLSFLKKEKDLCNRIEELEKSMGDLSQKNSLCFCDDKFQKNANDVENGTINSVRSKDGRNMDESLLGSELGAKERIPDQNGIDRAPIRSTIGTNWEKEPKVSTPHTKDQGDDTELLSQMALLKERNESMENELKEMQERYSEISLKFAEVEGERQKLVMTIRNLKNAKKN